jgi:hypothetical protein
MRSAKYSHEFCKPIISMLYFLTDNSDDDNDIKSERANLRTQKKNSLIDIEVVNYVKNTSPD